MPRLGAFIVAAAAALAPAQDRPAQTVQPTAPKTPAPSAAPTTPSADTPTLDRALVAIRREAAAVSEVVDSELAKGFLATADQLPAIETRMLYRDRGTREAIDEAAFAALPEDQKLRFKARPCDTTFYYTTGYGSPTIYARPLDVLAKHGVASLRDKKVMDFGYGMIGQERMMALMGAEAHGVDVEQMFAILYSKPGDTGEITAKDGTKGRIALHNGQWPGDAKVAAAVGGGYDVIMSKNTLKRGYIHPARETDPSRLVHLGVSDEEFVKATFEALKPGGLFLVYNICPKQAPDDKPYIPWADGEFPFPREIAEKAGFEVLEFDQKDDERIREVFAALEEGKTPESLRDDTFAQYTLLRRPKETTR